MVHFKQADTIREKKKIQAEIHLAKKQVDTCCNKIERFEPTSQVTKKLL